MYANHRHYILFVLAFLTFVVTVLGFAYLRNEIYKNAIKVSETNKEIKALEDKKAHEEEVASAYSKFSDEKTLLSSFIVSKDHIVDFIESVEKIGNDTSTGLELSGIETQDAAKTPPGQPTQVNFPHIKAHVTAKGSWANIMRALGLLEHMHYSLSFDNIHLSTDGGGSGSADLSIGTTTKPVTKTPVWNLSVDVRALVSPQ